MSVLAVDKAVKGLFASGWNNPSVKFVGDNEAEPAKAKEWVRVSIRPAAANQASMGAASNTTRTVGAIIVGIFVEPGKGTARAAELADQVIEALQYKRVLGDNWWIQTRSASPREIGQPAGSSYYQFSVTVNYYSDRIR